MASFIHLQPNWIDVYTKDNGIQFRRFKWHLKENPYQVGLTAKCYWDTATENKEHVLIAFFDTNSKLRILHHCENLGNSSRNKFKRGFKGGGNYPPVSLLDLVDGHNTKPTKVDIDEVFAWIEGHVPSLAELKEANDLNGFQNLDVSEIWRGANAFLLPSSFADVLAKFGENNQLQVLKELSCAMDRFAKDYDDGKFNGYFEYVKCGLLSRLFLSRYPEHLRIGDSFEPQATDDVYALRWAKQVNQAHILSNPQRPISLKGAWLVRTLFVGVVPSCLTFLVSWGLIAAAPKLVERVSGNILVPLALAMQLKQYNEFRNIERAEDVNGNFISLRRNLYTVVHCSLNYLLTNYEELDDDKKTCIPLKDVFFDTSDPDFDSREPEYIGEIDAPTRNEKEKKRKKILSQEHDYLSLGASKINYASSTNAMMGASVRAMFDGVQACLVTNVGCNINDSDPDNSSDPASSVSGSGEKYTIWECMNKVASKSGARSLTLANLCFRFCTGYLPWNKDLLNGMNEIYALQMIRKSESRHTPKTSQKIEARTAIETAQTNTLRERCRISKLESKGYYNHINLPAKAHELYKPLENAGATISDIHEKLSCTASRNESIALDFFALQVFSSSAWAVTCAEAKTSWWIGIAMAIASNSFVVYTREKCTGKENCFAPCADVHDEHNLDQDNNEFNDSLSTDYNEFRASVKSRTKRRLAKLDGLDEAEKSNKKRKLGEHERN